MWSVAWKTSGTWRSRNANSGKRPRIGEQTNRSVFHDGGGGMMVLSRGRGEAASKSVANDSRKLATVWLCVYFTGSFWCLPRFNRAHWAAVSDSSRHEHIERSNGYMHCVYGLVPPSREEGLVVLIFVFEVQRRVCFIWSRLEIDADWSFRRWNLVRWICVLLVLTLVLIRINGFSKHILGSALLKFYFK